MQRLHIKRLISIGVVEEGDNPEADILFWKAAPTRPGRREDKAVSTSAPPAVGSRASMMPGHLEMERRARRNDTQTRGTAMTQHMTAEMIADAVTKQAVTMRSQPEFWDKTEVELRVGLWKRTPGLHDAYSAARRDPDGFRKSNQHAEALGILKRWKDEAGG